MPAEIIDRGRGPEIAGTRVTVYRIMDYLKEAAPPARIADELHLAEEELLAALRYIEQHRAQVEADYQAILQRLDQQRAATAMPSTTPEELKRRIGQRDGSTPHAGASRQ